MGFGLNPYLPFWETVPDGEPHVFDGRIYIYGSHDERNGYLFCTKNYVCYSAPEENPTDWRYEGEIYNKFQDPINGEAAYDGELPAFEGPMGTREHPHNLYAPDVAKGPDGRYYLYYALDFVNVISVAVCDTPAGKYKFLGYVTRPDGSIPNVGRWFDPGILSEEGGNYLYYGFAPTFRFPGMEGVIFPGSMMVRLADDMHTILSEPVCAANGPDTCKGTGYEAHPFFEASSIRHYGDWYYLVYSSLQGHELCYGMSRTPEGPFEYKGVIVSNADLGYEGNELPVNYYGNNHGGLVQAGGKTYIFWHRHTHGTEFGRQGCADEIQILEDGTIPQICITSCGLNGGPLPARGEWESYIACHVTGPDPAAVGHVTSGGPDSTCAPTPPAEVPFITEEPIPGADFDDPGKSLKPYIRNLQPGAAAGFKYFAFDGSEKEAALEVRGTGKAVLLLDAPAEEKGAVIGEISFDSSEWKTVSAPIPAMNGTHAFYLRVTEGCLDFARFSFR